MRLLFLSFYFEPDLCAGSFRNTPLFHSLLSKISSNDYIHVITTMPNRYHTYSVDAKTTEYGNNYRIDRIQIPKHKNGFVDQIKSFFIFYKETIKIVKNKKIDIVYASSSRLFTAYLGRKISVKKNSLLFLDIRDIFIDTLKDIFEGKPFIFRIPLINFLQYIEKYTFKNANYINLVSEGFKDYFAKYKKPQYSYLTNGIDEIFLNDIKTIPRKNSVKTITYAGNIGSGQGLEKIIPQAAKLLGDKYLFRVIGDGGTKHLLVNKIKELGVQNVEIIAPVSRDALLDFYERTDFLFLHLNDLEAFKKVLPSKLFEYAVFPVPIIAGVSGYACKFIKENITNSIVFQPTNFQEMVDGINGFNYVNENRECFIEKFSRQKIINELANKIISCSCTISE